MPEILIDNTVTISRDDFGHTVRCGDRYENHLDPGEALFVVASLLLNAPRVPYLRTAAAHAAHDAAIGMGPAPAGTAFVYRRAMENCVAIGREE